MSKLIFDVKVPPIQTVDAICTSCNKKVESKAWTAYGNIPRVKSDLKKRYQRCPYCKEVFDHVKTEEAKPTWVKVATNEYKAVARGGDFLVWKDGYAWKCRYRKHGEKAPEWVERYFFKEGAMGKCEQNKNWVV